MRELYRISIVISVLLMCTNFLLSREIYSKAEMVRASQELIDSLNVQIEVKEELNQKLEKKIKTNHYERIQKNFQQAD